MTTSAKVLRYVAFGAMLIFALLGGAFVVGETLMDPGGVLAVALSAAWVVPMVALAGYALWRPDQAARVLTVAAALVAGFVVLDALLGLVPLDKVGPVGSIMVFAVAVTLGFLGLHRPERAGWLLLFVGAANLSGVVGKMLRAGDGPPLDAALGGSSGAVAVPVLIIGVLFLVAAAAQPRPHRDVSDAGRQARPARSPR